MKTIGVGFLLLLSAWAAMAQVVERKLCEAAVVEVMDFEYKVVRDMTVGEISQEQRRWGAHNFSAGSVGLGMVAVSNVLEVSVRATDQGCDSLVVRTGYERARLYVAKELVEASRCGARHVQAHEQKHIEIYEGHVKAMKDSVPAVVASMLQSAGSKSREELLREVERAVDAVLFSVQSKHNELDSPQEYDANARACRGEIAMVTMGLSKR